MQLRTLKSLVEYLLFLPVNRIARGLSYRGAGKLGSALGGFVWRCAGYRKKISLDNLTRAFPEKPEAEHTAGTDARSWRCSGPAVPGRRSSAAR